MTIGLIDNGKGGWLRSPLAHLVEAADDICYKIIDIEDGLELGILNFSDYRDLIRLVDEEHSIADDNYPPGQARRVFSSHRGRLFDRMIAVTVETFFENYDDVMSGAIVGDLAEHSEGDVARLLKSSSDLCRERIFTDRRKAVIEIGVHRNVETTLGTFCDAVLNFVIAHRDGHTFTGVSKKVVEHVESEGFKMPKDLYPCLRGVIDYVAGATDRYATYVAQHISGNVS